MGLAPCAPKFCVCVVSYEPLLVSAPVNEACKSFCAAGVTPCSHASHCEWASDPYAGFGYCSSTAAPSSVRTSQSKCPTNHQKDRYHLFSAPGVFSMGSDEGCVARAGAYTSNRVRNEGDTSLSTIDFSPSDSARIC